MRLLLLLLLMTACRSEPQRQNQPSPVSQEATPTPLSGAVVAEESTSHTDGLNRFTFRVTVTKAPERGVYNVSAEDGPNKGETQFTLPKGGEDHAVVLRITGDATRMEIGFRAPGDTTFYPYYEVASEGKTIRAAYTHAYRFE